MSRGRSTSNNRLAESQGTVDGSRSINLQNQNNVHNVRQDRGFDNDVPEKDFSKFSKYRGAGLNPYEPPKQLVSTQKESPRDARSRLMTFEA